MKIPKALVAEIRSGSMGYLVVRVVTGMLVLISMILLTRVLGATEYGRYTFALSIISLIVMFSQQGLPTLILRETARANFKSSWAAVRGLWRWSMICAGSLACILGSALYLILRWQSGNQDMHEMRYLPVIALLLPPIMVMLNNRVAILRGFRFVIVAILLQRGLSVLAVVIGITSAVFLFGLENVSAELVLTFELAGFCAALVLAAAYLYVRSAPLMQRTERLIFEQRYWLSAAVPLGLVVGLRAINMNMDVITLAWFVTPSEIGVYKVAVRVATMALLGQEVVIMVMSAHFASLHAQNNTQLLELLMRKVARYSALVAALVLLVFVVLGRELLGLIFGPEFENAYLPLLIITATYTCSTGLGAVSTLLNMTGHEKYTAQGAAIASVINLLLNLALIPFLGLVGAAIATSVALLVWTIYLWRSVRSLLAIKSSIF